MNVFQMQIHMVFISLINKMSFNFDETPQILTDGFLWFKDLSSPDPYGILPIIGGIVTLLNTVSTSTSNISSFARKLKRFLYLVPMISIPIYMTFPVVKYI